MKILSDWEIEYNFRMIKSEYERLIKQKRKINNRIKSLEIALLRTEKLRLLNNNKKIFFQDSTDNYHLLDSFDIDFERICKAEIKRLNVEIEIQKEKLKSY